MSDVVDTEEDTPRDVGRGRDIGRGWENNRKRNRSEDDEDYVRSDASEDHHQPNTSQPETSGLSHRVREHATGRRSNTTRNRELPNWFTESSSSMEQQYWQGFEARCSRVFRELQKSDGQLVRDVFRFEDPREYEDLIGCIQKDEHYRGRLLQVCREDTHVHVVHDCNFANGTCRCNWYKKAKTYGAGDRRDKRGHRRNSCRSRTETDIQNLLFYYCTKQRSIVYQKIGGQVERLPREGYNLSERRLDEMPEFIRQMAAQMAGDGDKLLERFSNVEDDEPDQRAPHRIHANKRRKLGYQEKLQLLTLKLLREYPTCPPESIVKTAAWRQCEDLRFKSVSDPFIKIAINVFKNEIAAYTLKDFNDMYSHPECKPLFFSGITPYDQYYYNVENSIQIMSDLVNYQCHGEEDAILDFVTTLYNVLERKLPKLNCIVVYSQPSAGKNFFFDTFKEYFLNSGDLQNPTRYNSFAFQNAEGRRFLMWNEPNYSEEFLEPLKKLLGGDSTTVNVKYMPDAAVYRTPVIVLTNAQISLMNHAAFVDRIRVFHWMPAPYLANYDKKPNPLAVYHFFAKYNLV